MRNCSQPVKTNESPFLPSAGEKLLQTEVETMFWTDAAAAHSVGPSTVSPSVRCLSRWVGTVRRWSPFPRRLPKPIKGRTENVALTWAPQATSSVSGHLLAWIFFELEKYKVNGTDRPPVNQTGTCTKNFWKLSFQRHSLDLLGNELHCS